MTVFFSYQFVPQHSLSVGTASSNYSVSKSFKLDCFLDTNKSGRAPSHTALCLSPVTVACNYTFFKETQSVLAMELYVSKALAITMCDIWTWNTTYSTPLTACINFSLQLVRAFSMRAFMSPCKVKYHFLTSAKHSGTQFKGRNHVLFLCMSYMWQKAQYEKGPKKCPFNWPKWD